MVERFEAELAAPHAAGLRLDYDHFSYDTQRPSEAAGWITALEGRVDGLWARVRWTDTGEAAVRNGRYRFLSPAWLARDLEEAAGGEGVEAGEKRWRPLRLDSAGLTNNPNLRGLAPLSNREAVAAVKGSEDGKQDGQTTRERSEMSNQLRSMLGLEEGASERDVLEAVQALRNRATNAEGRVARLTDEKAALEAAQVEADLARYAERLKPEAREGVRQALLRNRTETIAVLEAVAAGPAVQPYHNRATAGTPAGLATATPEETAARQRAEVLAYKNRHGCSFEAAWQAVRAEKAELFK
jgi:phage I-like protein